MAKTVRKIKKAAINANADAVQDAVVKEKLLGKELCGQDEYINGDIDLSFLPKTEYDILAWADIREHRDKLLFASDVYMISDHSTTMKNEWIIYRQKLRDVPQYFENPEDVVMPIPPDDPKRIMRTN